MCGSRPCWRRPASIPGPWFIMEGADLPTMNRSIPMTKALDDAMIAPTRTARINPANGYPMRLLLPGYEGNMNVKWLRRIKLVNPRSWRSTRPGSTRSCGRTAKPGSSISRRRSSRSSRIRRRTEHEGTGLLRGFRHRLFRQRPHQQGRRRPTAARAGRGAARPGAEQGVHPFRMAWNWDGRWSCSRAVDEAATSSRPAKPSSPSVAAPGTPNVAAFTMEHCNAICSWDRGQRRGETCLRVTRLRSPSRSRSL